jgi:hypothetical protein
MFGNYSSMAINYAGTSNGSAFNFSSSYHVIYASGTGASRVYKVSVNDTGTSGENTSTSTTEVENATVWMYVNGTVIATEFEGQNFTGFEAMIGSALFGPFVAEVPQSNLISYYTSSTYVHKVNSTTAKFGPTTMSVTNWAANSIPETIQTCSGTVTLQSFTLQTGAPTGSTYSVLTRADVTTTSNGSTDMFHLRLLSITKASY